MPGPEERTECTGRPCAQEKGVVMTYANRFRTLRRVAGLGVCGAAALTALALTAPSAAAATLEVTNLPTAVTMSRTDVVSVRIVDAPVCAVGAFQAFIAGRQDAVTLNDSGGVSTARCSGTTLLATVTPTTSAKRNAVVKFRLIKPDNSRVVMTLVVHVRR